MGLTSTESEYALSICLHCKNIWIQQPKRCNCGRSFFGKTHIANLPFAQDAKKTKP